MELLVVIAIIALLVSILLPSLMGARELAVRAACSANMKAQGSAISTYIAEYDGQMPTIMCDRPGMWANDTMWNQLSAGGWKAWMCPDFQLVPGSSTDDATWQNAARQGGGYGSTFMECLGTRWAARYASTPEVRYCGHPNAGSLRWLDYKGNGFGRVDAATAWKPMIDEVINAWYLIGKSHRESDVPQASDVAGRVELYPAYGGWPNWTNGWTFYTLGGNVRHLGSSDHPEGGNCLFLDAHVSWSDLWGPLGNSGVDIGLPWNGFVYTAPRAPVGWEDYCRAGPTWYR